MAVSISLIITSYNRERYLSAAIESILAQTRRDFELLIWDDGSTDGSVEIARNYAKQDARVKVVAAGHQGRTPALKAAIAHTTGSYIGIVDSDDILAPTALDETAAVLEANPSVGLVYTDYMDIDESGKVIGYGKRCCIPYSKNRLLLDFMTFHFRLMRREVFQQVGGFDESCPYAEDYDLCLKLSEVTQVRHLNKPLYYYRSHSSTITHQYQLKQAQDSCKAIRRALDRRGLANHCQVNLQILQSFPFKSRILFTVKKVSRLLLAALPLVGAIAISPAQAQSIIPAADGTNTLVTPNGNRIDISGGQQSGDGANLFHSFSQFDVNQNQTANFLSNPSIQNILGRVNSGNPSVINGLIQVTGGNSNLVLMNPAGIIFGAGARLNVPADFTATTATSIGIGSSWFNASGANNYADLVGTPSDFAFNTSQPGAIVNAGQLSVNSNKNLTLLSGTAVNTGTLTAPGGSLTVVAVPGENLVRISQPGRLLSLEIQPLATASTQPGMWTLPILSLPQLLTGSGGDQATGVSVNSNGQVVLTSSGVQVPSDTGTTIVSGSLNVSPLPDQGGVGGTINVLGDKVGLVAANINATGRSGGGSVRIGGDYQGQGTIPNASRTYVSRDSVITADAGSEGDGGRVIIWADKTTEFFGSISARGGTNSGNGGFAEVSGKQNLAFDGTVDLRADHGNLGTLLLDPEDITIVAGAYSVDDFQLFDGQILADDARIASFTISESALENATFTGGVILQATNNITINDLPDNALTFVATGNGYTPGSIEFTADADGDGVGSFVMNAGDTIQTGGRALTISAASITAGSIDTSSTTGNGASINLTSTQGDIRLFSLNSSSSATDINSRSGQIELNANGNIQVDSSINSSAIGGDASGIFLSSTTGNINAAVLPGAFLSTNSSSSTFDANPGRISLTAPNGIVTIGPIIGRVFSFDATGLGINVTSDIITIGNNDSRTIRFDGPVSIDRDVTFFSGVSSGIFFSSSLDIGDNTLTLQTDNRIVFNGGNNSVIGTGSLVLQTATPNEDILIGGSGNDFSAFLTIDSINALQDGFESITIGREDGTGTVTISDNITFNDPVTIQAGNSITATGAITGLDNASITLRANNDITTSNITANPGISIISNSGAIDTSAGTLDTSSPFGNGGNLALSAPLSITTGAINSTGLPGTGNISFTSNEIDFLGGANSAQGSGILLLQPFASNQSINIGGTTDSGTGTLDITATDLTALQNGFSSITIGGANSSGTITIANPVTFNDPVTIQAPEGAGTITATGAITGLDNASITLRANQNITTSNITANPGITIISNSGAIDTSNGILDSSSSSNSGGAIRLTATASLNALSAASDITTNNITSHSDTSAGGDITLNSQTGVVSSGNLDASGNTRGGNITVIARNQITARQINSSATTGDGGNVMLDPIGDIQVDSINAQGGTSGNGGTVDITTNQFFRALSSFSDRNGINASISTAGGTGGGDIIIRHDGGARNIPFVVGNAATNGTAGAITTGSSNSILPEQSFPGSYTQSNIQLITQNPPPPPSPSPFPSPTVSPSPQPDSDRISRDIQGETPVFRGIDAIPRVGMVLLNTTSIVREDIEQALSDGQIEKAIALLEQLRLQEFQNYFENNLSVETTESASLEQTQTVLSSIAENTGKTPAVIYVFSQPELLQLILVTPKSKPMLKSVYQANNADLLKAVATFRSQVTEPRNKTGYQATAKQLYEWLVAPLEAELRSQKIDTLVFSMDGGLRSLPLAALYDGQQFLVEKYSIGLIPSINLTDTRYQDVKTTEVLAMGASKFSDQDPLPAVPVELSTIVGNQDLKTENRELLSASQSSLLGEGLWSGEGFLNQGFTLSNLKAQRTQVPFGVIHLATHGQFNLGAPRNSYIQLWDTKLRLDQLRQMGWNNPSVELLVLSACRTALGNEDAEFGFGGLAVAAGVKSALASLWYVSDEGTLALISEFYQRLKTAPIKAEALREAQIAMIKGQVRIEGGKLQGIEQEDGTIFLPPELAKIGNKDLSHPYYWSAFTMIGSPW